MVDPSLTTAYILCALAPHTRHAHRPAHDQLPETDQEKPSFLSLTETPSVASDGDVQKYMQLVLGMGRLTPFSADPALSS